MSPETAQAWSTVFGGGLGGSIIALLAGANLAQYLFARRDRDRAATALAEANKRTIEISQQANEMARDFHVAMSKHPSRRHDKTGT